MENFVSKMEKLSINDRGYAERTQPQSKNSHRNNANKLLCMDVLNFSKEFVNFDDHWDFDSVADKVNAFVVAAKNTGYVLELFIDAQMKTNETLQVWRGRRENEVLNEPSKAPCNMSQLLGEYFEEKGIKVHHSVAQDNDDTIATFAHLLNGCILSGDKDFLCYDVGFELYFKYYVNNNFLKLVTQKGTSWKVGKVFRKVMDTIPATSSDWKEYMLGPKFNNYLRGCPSSLIKYFPNPHEIVKDLRLTLFNHLGVRNVIYEEYPSYDAVNKAVKWIKNEVDPSKCNSDLSRLLLNPDIALDFYKGHFVNTSGVKFSRQEWSNHVFALFAIILEMCSVATKGKQSLLSLLRKYKQLAFKYIDSESFSDVKANIGSGVSGSDGEEEPDYDGNNDVDSVSRGRGNGYSRGSRGRGHNNNRGSARGGFGQNSNSFSGNQGSGRGNGYNSEFRGGRGNPRGGRGNGRGRGGNGRGRGGSNNSGGNDFDDMIYG